MADRRVYPPYSEDLFKALYWFWRLVNYHDGVETMINRMDRSGRYSPDEAEEDGAELQESYDRVMILLRPWLDEGKEAE